MIKKYVGYANLIAVLTIMASMLAVAIICEAPAPTEASEVIIEYSYEEEIPEVVEDNEVDFASDFDYYTWLIGYAAEINDVDPILAISVSRLETGNWNNIDKHFNFGGLSINEKPMSFDSEVEGLEKYINLLKWYQKQGMDTPEKMAKVYCPMNTEWSKRVRNIMKEVDYESYQ